MAEPNRSALADRGSSLKTKHLANSSWQSTASRDRLAGQRAKPETCKSFRYWDLEGIRAKMSSPKSWEALILLGFLHVGLLKPAKYWDLIGIHPSDPQ